MGVLPKDGLTEKLGTPDAYAPEYVEASILDFLENDFLQCRSNMGEQYVRLGAYYNMAMGTYLRDPTDRSRYSRFYEPILALYHRALVSQHMMRLVPDPQTMDAFSVRISDDYDEAEAERVAQQLGIPADQMVEEVENCLTVMLRRYLRKSKFLQVAARLSLARRRYGTAIGMVHPKFSPVSPMAVPDAPEAPDLGGPELDYALDEMAETGDESAVDELIGETEPDPVPSSLDGRTPYRFDGFQFDCVSLFNILIPDLRQDGGITALPYFYVYNVKRWREMDEFRIRGKGDAKTGFYANMDCIGVVDELDMPTVQDESAGGALRELRLGVAPIGYASWRSVVTAAGKIQVPVRIGTFEAEQVQAFRNKPPTKAEWRKFADKFNFAVEELETATHWIAEWARQGSKTVLVRFQPYRIPMQEEWNVEGVAVESRYWIADGMTLGLGDYAIGGAAMEITANDAWQNEVAQSQRLGRPMFAVDFNAIDPRYRQLVGNKITYRADGTVPIVRAPIGGKLMDPIGPVQTQVDTCVRLYKDAKDRCQSISGTYPQQVGGKSGAESATEAAQQGNMSDIMVQAELMREEQDLILPLLRRALAIMVEEIKRGDGMEISLSPSELSLWLDAQHAAEMRVCRMVTPDMIISKFDVEITTMASTGDRETRLTRMERLLTMLTDPAKVAILQAQGYMPVVDSLLRKYARELGEPRVIRRNMLPATAPPEMGGAPMPGMGNPGGAGIPRPGYTRTAGEVSAPSEPMPNEPLSSPVPGVEMLAGA